VLKKSPLAAVRQRLTFANVTSGLALFVALGGTGYAAATLPDNSVGTNQIRYHGVTNTDLAPDSVRSWQISKDAVGNSEIRPNAVKAWEIATDAVGGAEIRKNAVGTDELADGGVEPADLSAATKTAFTLGRAAVTKAGAAAGGNAKSAAPGATPGTYSITFDHDVSACQYSATLATVRATPTTTDAPDPGSITVAPGSAATQVDVKTFAEDATTHALTAAPQPFHLLVSC
jgi:hypothetical protein